MKKLLSFLAVISLTACAAGTPMKHGGEHMEEADTSAFAIEDRSDAGELRFEITENGRHFVDYGVSHTKRMHVIVIRDDLSEFQHLHPVQDQDGVWTVPYAAVLGGTYWIYADFVRSDETPVTLQFTQVIDKNPGFVSFHEEPETTITLKNGYTGLGKIVDDFRVYRSTTGMDDGSTAFDFSIYTADEQPAVIEPYLGAMGHTVLISRSGDFIHTHPTEVGEDVSDDVQMRFVVPKLQREFYRAFTQFQVGDVVHTARFDWDAR